MWAAAGQGTCADCTVFRGSAVFHDVSFEKPSLCFKELKVINNAESVSKEKTPVCHHQ